MSPFFYTQTLFLFYSISLFTLSSFHTACLYLSLYFLHSNYLSNLLSLSLSLSLSLKHTLSSFHTIFYLTHTLSLSLSLSLSLFPLFAAKNNNDDIEWYCSLVRRKLQRPRKVGRRRRRRCYKTTSRARELHNFLSIKSTPSAAEANTDR